MRFIDSNGQRYPYPAVYWGYFVVCFFSYFGYTAERATGPNGNGSKNKYRKKVEGISKDFVVKI